MHLGFARRLLTPEPPQSCGGLRKLPASKPFTAIDCIENRIGTAPVARDTPKQKIRAGYATSGASSVSAAPGSASALSEGRLNAAAHSSCPPASAACSGVWI